MSNTNIRWCEAPKHGYFFWEIAQSFWRASRPRKEGEGVLGICAICMAAAIPCHMGRSFYVAPTPVRRRYLSHKRFPQTDIPWDTIKKIATHRTSKARRCKSLRPRGGFLWVYWSIVALCMLIGIEWWSIRTSILILCYGYGNYGIERVKKNRFWGVPTRGVKKDLWISGKSCDSSGRYGGGSAISRAARANDWSKLARESLTTIC